MSCGSWQLPSRVHKVSRFESWETVAIGPDNAPIIANDGDYIFPDDEWVEGPGLPTEISKQAEETPEYQVSMVLYENGISGDMSLNYGDFVLDAKLTDIKLLDVAACN